MNTLGLDIGGANIKAADSTGQAKSRPFAIWKHPERLSEQILWLLREYPQADRVALTMTAELADCFETRRAGVEAILDQVASVLSGRSLIIWTTEGRFVTAREAMKDPIRVAAANWHALATWIGKRYLSPGSANPAILIDIGTTTTDLIPIVKGIPATVGLTDLGRLQSGELCYSGIKRTPLCGVAHSVPFRDGYCTVAAELFATTLDAWLLLGELEENSDDLETANGKPATCDAAHDRIARMLCSDREDVTLDEAIEIARFMADVQRQRLAGALERVLQRLPTSSQTAIVSGSGAFLARRLIEGNRRLKEAQLLSLDQMLTPAIAESACAYSVAQLADSMMQ